MATELSPETYEPHAYWNGREFEARCPWCDLGCRRDRQTEALAWMSGHVDRHRIERAQAAYVEQWRAEHPLETFGESWACPLCREVLQVKDCQAAEYAASLAPGRDLLQDDIVEHKRWHGADWLTYQQAGQP